MPKSHVRNQFPSAGCCLLSWKTPVFFLFTAMTGYAPLLWARSLDSAPPKPEGPAKIQSSLWNLAAIGQAAAKSTGAAAENTVVVTLVPHPGMGSASIDSSSFAGLGVRMLARSKSLMRVSVPASSLLAVSEIAGVRFVRRPHRPHAQQEETWSEGGWLIGAYDNYFAGVVGEGVKVAVIDGGFKGANELSGEMPARWRYRDYTGEGIYAGESVHGTACAEIVHDMAQGAELTLLKVGDLVDLENAKDLCVRDGIDIVNHSMGWFGTGIGDGRGIACDIVNDAADKGILWVNSAGNDAESHYYGFWSDFDSDGWHNFGDEDEVLGFEAEKGDQIRVFLTWNDWPDSRQNYDLYLDFVNASGDLEFVAESTDRQNVSGGEPVESIEYEVEKSGEYGISVRSVDARPRRLKVWSLNHDFEEYSIAENSIGSPADARGAMSVGAIQYDFYDLGIVASYSSRGPTTDGRFKPELVAPSGVSTVSYGKSEDFYGYTGTSAAAPHVAGAAALIKSANPSFSRDDLWNALIAATVDIDVRGRDNNSGYGKLLLPVMEIQEVVSPRIDKITMQRRSRDILVTVDGTNFGPTRGTSSITIGSARISSSSFSVWTDSRIRFSIPHNTRSADLRVRTSEGTSNALLLDLPGPYLRQVSPNSLRPGERLTLTGSYFNNQRGNGYVLFHSNVRPSSSDYVSWGDGRIVVKVPARAQSGNVKVVTVNGSSGNKRIQVEEIVEPRIASVSPSRVRYNQIVTIRGTGFGATRGTSKVVFYLRREPGASQYVSWSDTRIQVRVPTGARTGNLRVETATGDDTARLTITSPWVRSISPRSGRSNTLVTVSGSNFGSSRGTSTVRIGSATIRSFSSWSNSRIRFRIPVNTRSGNLSVRTSNGTSNTVFLEVTSPYLSRVSPARLKTGDRLTLTGANFRSTRGSGYVLFTPNLRPLSGDYVTWTDSRIVVEVPSRAESGNVKVVTLYGSSGNSSIEVEAVEPLPSTGTFGYNPPSLTKNPKSVKFGYEGDGSGVMVTWSLKNDAEVEISLNDEETGVVPESDDWQRWWTILLPDLNGQNEIEFRNKANLDRTDSFTRWQLKDVELWSGPNYVPVAKPIAGARFLETSVPVLQPGLGDPFPAPFNASVTIPYTTVVSGHVRFSVYNLMGQEVRVLQDGWTEAGAHRVRWDGRTGSGTDAASGVYCALLETEGLTHSARLVLIR